MASPQYYRYDLEIHYHRDEGTLQLPAAYLTGTENQETSKIVSTSKSYGYKLVTFNITSLGGVPELPDPNDVSAGEVLKTVDIFPSPGGWATSGHKIYNVRGQYIYILTQPPSTQAGFSFGKIGPDRFSPPEVIRQNNLVTGLLK